MRHLVAFTFLRAPLTNARAQGTYLTGKLAIAPHVGGGQLTDLSAIEIELDAARELVPVGLEEAGFRAMPAGLGACVARIDT
jgi:hypothetical protein